MVMIIKAIAVLILEIVIYYIMGTAVVDKFHNKVKRNIGFQILTGFIAYQILFQVCALPFIWMKRSLTELAYVWAVLVSVLTVAALVKERKQIVRDLFLLRKVISTHRFTALITALAVLIVCWYTSLNGELNDDSLYYIGVVNTTLTTDTMFQYNAYTGMAMPSHYFRRVLVTFEINAAALCRIFGIHPIILMRVFRGNLNVILTAIAIGLLGTAVFTKEKDAEKPAILVCVSMILYFIADRTIYSNAAFFLSRTYEGKAYAGNILIYFMIYLCICLIKTGEKKYLLWIVALIWGCTAISSSAIMVTIAGAGVLLLSYVGYRAWIRKTEQK